MNTRQIHTKFIFCENNYTKKNVHKKCWLIQLQQFFYRDQPVFPLILIFSLIQRLFLLISLGLKFINSNFFLAREIKYTRKLVR